MDFVKNTFFKRAVPVFAEGYEKEIHINCGFYGKINYKTGKVVFKAAASSFYRFFLNGEFVNYGPARCGHGFYRVDEIDITDKMKEGINHLAVEVVGYNINSFFAIDQPSFLQCEVFTEDKSVLATLPDDKNHRGTFKGFLTDARVRKTQKYSFQRAMTEVYNLYPGVYDWRTGIFTKAKAVNLVKTEKKRLTKRVLPLNVFTEVKPKMITYEGTVTKIKPEKRWSDRSLTQISPILKGFKDQELEVHLSDEMQEISTASRRNSDVPYYGFNIISEDNFTQFSFECEKTGFICCKFDCLSEKGEFFFMFDETVRDGEINPLCKDFCNGIKISCEKGVYDFSSFECYGFKHLKIVVTKGKFVFFDLRIREYVSPIEITYKYTGTNEAHKRVFKAAEETFKQNSADLFMDCPTRERAGWLCDSFFTARAEKFFTGKNITEYVFLQNYLLAEKFDCIPEGMLPMCYPADHYDGVFIPNWAMWFVLELEDAVRRGQDPELVYGLKNKVYRLAEYFEKFENELGLLENLESWIFIEWSKANDLVRDVNYPTNMCYSAFMRAIGRIYGDEKYLKKAEKLVEIIRKRSFNGEFFRDREIRKDGKLTVTDEITETCQYYAFFFDIATPELYNNLWQKLSEEFGPDRKEKGLYPEVYEANSFIGNYLRLEILARYGMNSRLSEEIEGYFDYMAQKTGTLWEHSGDYASCNHGFAAYAACFADKCTDY